MDEKWGKPSPGSNTDPVYSGVGTDTFSWGDEDLFEIGANQIKFQPIPFVDVGLDSLFSIAHLNYFNGTVLLDTSVEQVPLNFDLFLDTEDTKISLSQSFKLDANIFNTINDSDDPQKNADSIEFIDKTSLANFSYDSKKYQIILAGFSQDDGVSLSNKISALEGETTTTRLYAKIVEVPVKARVPEPGMVFGVSLVAMYCIYRRQL